uniref:Uncharacterized protein n=1 Tax=viral metagenome TaxID=1070528 RepID=A0A6C0II37_9ZZZZ
MRFLSYLGIRFREGLENMGDASANTGSANTGSANTGSNNVSNLGKSTYTDPGLNDNPLYLATLNAANINYLKEQVDELNQLKQQVTALEPKVAQNTAGIAAMGDQFTQSAQQLTGRDPNSKEPIPSVTGLN